MKSLSEHINEARLFGGNSGYVGYSMSKRAASAREEGRYPKNDFKKIYGISDKVLDKLIYLGYISNNEWHHTSKFGNKTIFYSWENEAYKIYYESNKNIVVERIRKGEIDELEAEFDAFRTDYDNAQERVREKFKLLLKEYEKYRENYKRSNDTFVDGDEYLASNGCIVRKEGGVEYVYKDGERLSKRRGGGMRDAALNELKWKRNEWKNGLMSYKDFIIKEYDGIVRDIMGNDISELDNITMDYASL